MRADRPLWREWSAIRGGRVVYTHGTGGTRQRCKGMLPRQDAVAVKAWQLHHALPAAFVAIDVAAAAAAAPAAGAAVVVAAAAAHAKGIRRGGGVGRCMGLLAGLKAVQALQEGPGSD